MNNHSDQKYFDLHVNGIGYLYRARKVNVNRGEAFLAVDASALHGSADNVEYTRFDCRVSGTAAVGHGERTRGPIVPASRRAGRFSGVYGGKMQGHPTRRQVTVAKIATPCWVASESRRTKRGAEGNSGRVKFLPLA